MNAAVDVGTTVIGGKGADKLVDARYVKQGDANILGAVYDILVSIFTSSDENSE